MCALQRANPMHKPDHNYRGHSDIGHNYAGHDHVVRNYVGHNYMRHDYFSACVCCSRPANPTHKPERSVPSFFYFLFVIFWGARSDEEVVVWAGG